jgi:hypothetical protein
VFLLALLITVVAGLVSWRQWQQVGGESPGEAQHLPARFQTLAGSGVAINAMFFLVILAQAIPQVILAECD